MSRRRQHVPWRAAGSSTEQESSADDVVRETGWVFNNRGDHMTLQEFVRTLPFLVQCLACAVLADLVQYTVHRLFHQVRRLWPFHAVHHSSRNMDWLAGSRLHLVDVLVTRGLSFVPLFVLGF